MSKNIIKPEGLVLLGFPDEQIVDGSDDTCYPFYCCPIPGGRYYAYVWRILHSGHNVEIDYTFDRGQLALRFMETRGKHILDRFRRGDYVDEKDTFIPIDTHVEASALIHDFIATHGGKRQGDDRAA